MRYDRQARDTLSVLEMDVGDALRFTRRDGGVVELVLRGARARVLDTTNRDTRVPERGGHTTIGFAVDVEVNGAPHTLERVVGAQESFYEPWVLDGLRLWPDAVDDIFEHITETHGACRPRRRARFAFNDAADRILPEPLHAWCPLPPGRDTLDIRDCYNADDCWMGAYFGASAHGGLDINHPAGTPIFAPFSIDFHYLFNAVRDGHENNRWRGVRRFANGALWIIQVHHLIRLAVPEFHPIPAGAVMADGAGVWVGDHDHSHFVFRIIEEDQDALIDPWILFWQYFRDRRAGRAPAPPGR